MKRFDPAEAVARYLAKSLGYDDERRQVMAYGLGALFQMLLLFVCSFIFGLVFNCLIEAMILFWGVGLLRRATGGVHCTTYFGCVCTSLTSICGLAAICRYAVPTDAQTWIYGLAGILPAFICLAWIAWKKVPRASANKPIVNPAKIARLRKQCFLTVSVYLAAACMLLFFSPDNPRLISACSAIIAVAWWSAFMLTDMAAKLIEGIDSAVQIPK